jgi:hypothetical protein
MDQQPITTTRQPWQFSLGSLLTAVVFVACASAAGRFVALNDRNPLPIVAPIVFLCFVSIPMLLCGAIGVLRGRLTFWLVYGIVLDFALFGLLTCVYIVVAAKSR